MQADHHDLMIVGTGPAGLTAAVHARRKGLSTVVFGDMPGGSMYRIGPLENFPGFSEPPAGAQCGMAMFTQAQAAGAVMPMVRLATLSYRSDRFEGIHSNGRKVSADAALIACGLVDETPDIPGAGLDGISTCCVCDAPLLRGKKATVAVYGNGNDAGYNCLALSRIAQRVILICPDPELVMDAAIEKMIRNVDGIVCRPAMRITAFHGDSSVSAVTVIESGDSTATFSLDGVFLAIGRKPDLKFLKATVSTDAMGFIRTDAQLMTSIPGLFAAGDVRDTDLRQVITACADGARAAGSAATFLEERS